MAATSPLIELPKLPAGHRDFLKYISSKSDQHPRTLLKPYVDYEARLREVFAQQPDEHPALKDDFVNSVPVYDGSEDALRVRARDIDKETAEDKSKYIMPLQDTDRKGHGSHAVVSTLQEFQTNFGIFSESSLSELDWNNVVAAGSSVVTSLMPVPAKYAESKRTKREWYHEKHAPASDVDLFLYGLTEEQAVEKIKQIESCIRDSVLQDTTTVRTKNAITIVSEYPIRHVQIVLRIYKSLSEILTGFDVDCSCAAYDGKQVYASPRALVSFMTQTNEIDLSRRSPSYENRLRKYAKRGFEVHWDPLDRDRIDPTIFERNFARTMGLARLLVYEKLPDQSDRESYIEERKVERGRPTTSHYFYRRRQQMPGNFKENAIEEVNEAIVEDAVSNYHTFTIPYGPKYSAKKIEKLLYTKDLLLNAEWNKSKDREVDLHRHPAFFGSVNDVVGDCCGLCPAPSTDEEKEIAEEESKTFVSGNISFLKDDPGRQAIGSFNPIDDDEWTKMAYVGDTARLCAAIANDDLEFIQKWCAVEGNDVNERDYCGRAPLHLAVMVSTPRIVQCLVDEGARLVARLVDGKTSLHLAAIRGGNEGLEMARILLRKSEANEEDEANKQDAKRKARETNKTIGGKSMNNNDDASDETGEEVESGVGAETPLGSTTEGSFVKVDDTDASPDASDMPQEEENQESPDIYDVNVYAWDVQVSALHFAVILGHSEVVKELVQSFGADVLIPVKLIDVNTRKPRAAILTPVLALNLPLSEAKSMAEMLLQLGASSSQADMQRHSVLHRFVAASRPEMLQVLLKHDAAAAQKAINFMLPYSGPYYFGPCGVMSPLITTIENLDVRSTEAVLGAGAKPAVTFKDIEKNIVNNSPSRMFGRNNQLTKDNWAQQIEQPILLAARYENARIVKSLLDKDAGLINTLNEDAHEIKFIEETPGQQQRYARNDTVGESLLDIVRNRIQALKEWNPLKMNEGDTVEILVPESLSAEKDFLANVDPASFKYNRMQSELRQGRESYERERESCEKQERVRKDNRGIALKAAAIRAAITEFEGLERLLLDRGAKTFKELLPRLVGINEEHKRGILEQNAPRQRLGRWQPTPWKFQPNLGFQEPNLNFGATSSITDDTQQGYEDVFEGAWSGDINLIRSRTVQKWGDDCQNTPLSVTSTSTDQFSPFTLAVVRGHLNCAREILDICAAQYVDPDDDSKKRYQINTDAMGEVSEDEDDLEVESEDEEGPLTTDIAIDVAQEVKSNISPQAALDCQLRLARVRQITPESLPPIDDIADLENTNMNILEYAIVSNNRKLFDWFLDLKLEYQREKQKPEDVLDESVASIWELTLAMRFGRTEMLNQLAKRTGVALPIETLIKNSGARIAEKTKYYPGLTVRGTKRKAWAQRGQIVYSNPQQSSTPPLLHAVFSGSFEAVTWALGPEPERMYKEFAQNNKASKHLQALEGVDGGFDGQLASWLRAKGNLAALIAVLKVSGSREYTKILRYLISNFHSSVLEAKSPTNGYTPLLLAFAGGDVENARILIDAGANQMCRDNQGNNLLHVLFCNLPSDPNELPISEKTKRELIDLIDRRLLSTMFLERSAENQGQSFLTPLAKWLRRRSSQYMQDDGTLLHKPDTIRYPDDPRNFLSEGSHNHIEKDLQGLQIFLDLSPENKDLDMLDGAGDTVAHLAVRWCMLPLFQKIIKRRPALLFRENAVGRTPVEMARDAWLARRLEWQPPIPEVGRPSHYGQLSSEPFSVATQPPQFFEGKERYEKRVQEGKPEDPETLTYVERIYQFATSMAQSEEHKGTPRRLVSLNEANIVAERLAQRDRTPQTIFPRRLRRRGQPDENSGVVDEVEMWMQ